MFPLNWFQVAAGGAAAFALSFLLHTVDVNRIDHKWQAKLDDQKISLEKSCAADKKLTEENSRDYQNKITDLSTQLAHAKRVLPTHCIMPASGKAHSGNTATPANVNARLDGVSSDALLDFAGECEQYRLQIISMQGFIDGVWKLKGVSP